MQALIPAHERYDRITGLAQQSAYPVNLRRDAGRVITRAADRSPLPG